MQREPKWRGTTFSVVCLVTGACVSLERCFKIFLFDFSSASEPVTCNHKDFACANGDCISSRFRCDGDYDCLDNSDEASMRCVTVCVHVSVFFFSM